MVLCPHRNFKGLSDYDENSLIHNDANILSNKKIEFIFQNEFSFRSLDYVKVSQVKPRHNAVDQNIFRCVN